MRFLASTFLILILSSATVVIADELSDLQAKAEAGDADAQNTRIGRSGGTGSQADP